MIKRGNILARNLHRWIGLFVGIQILIWLSSGLYMVVLDIDFIHGDPLVKNLQQAISVPTSSQVTVNNLLKQYPGVTHIGLQSIMGKTRYLVSTVDKRYLINPDIAEVISPLDEKTARDIARFHFNGDAPISHVALITSNPPMEIQSRQLPLWRIDFDDRYSTSFYIDPYSGKLATRRHRYWRIFDFVWMLHIMDYDMRTDAHNLLLNITQVFGLSFAISGLWLLFYSFGGRRKKKADTE